MHGDTFTEPLIYLIFWYVLVCDVIAGSGGVMLMMRTESRKAKAAEACVLCQVFVPEKIVKQRGRLKVCILFLIFSSPCLCRVIG